ncbi:MAG: hypothetical protein JWL77_2223, partial [Chthonomonadaceae bacterium]|nr:hypothetical protein [Chthonomonadaceae bacterium]
FSGSRAFYSALCASLPAAIFRKPPKFPLTTVRIRCILFPVGASLSFPTSRHVSGRRQRTCRLHNRSPRGSGGTADTLALGASAARREGSNPSFPTNISRMRKCPIRGSSSVVERYLAKVDVAGPNPVSRFKNRPSCSRMKGDFYVALSRRDSATCMAIAPASSSYSPYHLLLTGSATFSTRKDAPMSWISRYIWSESEISERPYKRYIVVGAGA